MKKLIIGIMCVLGLFAVGTSFEYNVALNEKPEITSIGLPGAKL